MAEKKYELLTRSGISLKVAVSTIQKEIRRGNERNAMLMCLDMIPQFEKYLWRRLLVIAQEDIGLADPDCVMFVQSQFQTYFEMRSKEWKASESYTMTLGNTILRMCRAKKSRLGDHFHVTMKQSYLNGEKPQVPDYALDKHTDEGRKLGRRWSHFKDEGCELIEVAYPLDHDPYHIVFDQLLEDYEDNKYGKKKFPPSQAVQRNHFENNQASLFDDEA